MTRLDRLRERQRSAVRATAQTKRLSDGRPDPPPDRSGLPCERCGGDTPAEEIQALDGTYWLCRQCHRLHLAERERTRKLTALGRK